MKTIIMGVLLSVVFLAGISLFSLVNTEHPVKEISGIVREVKVDTLNLYTTIEFDDDRIITFNGVYVGKIFSKNKECSFKYQYSFTMFSRGTYIVEFKCQE